ncbi:DUF536 domain-containing protein [Streptococcus pyogenes]|nr:DUF536 domain-containing protein [Streptococcus pyogenes]
MVLFLIRIFSDNDKEENMGIEKTVSELADILGVSRQAVNNRVKSLPEEDLDKNEKGVTVVKRSGLVKLEEIYKKTIFDDEPISEETKQRELLEILVDEKNTEITRLYEQLKAKDAQLASKDEQMRVKDVQIAEKDKQLDQQQQLTAKAMADKETLKLELEEAKAEANQARLQVEEVQAEVGPKKGFLTRLFAK